MSNYGFNENEVVSTKTIQIDKDGFHRVVDAADNGGNDGGNTSKDKDVIAVLQASSSGDQTHLAFEPMVRCSVKFLSDAHKAIETMIPFRSPLVFLAINPINSIDPSIYPTTLNTDEMEIMGFAYEYRLSPKPYDLVRNQDSEYVTANGSTYYNYCVGGTTGSGGSSEFTDLYLTFDMLENMDGVEKIIDESNGYCHYRFDLTLLILTFESQDSPIANIYGDVLHVETIPYDPNPVIGE